MTAKELNSSNKLCVKSRGPSHSRSSDASFRTTNDSSISLKAPGMKGGLMVVEVIISVS